jgi:hypothetical protein
MAPMRNFDMRARINQINLRYPYFLWKKFDKHSTCVSVKALCNIHYNRVIARILGPVFSFGIYDDH